MQIPNSEYIPAPNCESYLPKFCPSITARAITLQFILGISRVIFQSFIISVVPIFWLFQYCDRL